MSHFVILCNSSEPTSAIAFPSFCNEGEKKRKRRGIEEKEKETEGEMQNEEKNFIHILQAINLRAHKFLYKSFVGQKKKGGEKETRK